MRVTFWLLDINSEIRDGSAEIWLWGIDDSGNRVLIVDKNCVPYFYAVVEEGSEPVEVVKDIEKKLGSKIVKLEVVERRFFGRPVKAVKVCCQSLDDVPKNARSVRNLECVRDCLEDDIRFPMHYLVDNNVVPCGWHEVEAVDETRMIEAEVDRTYSAKSPPKTIDKNASPQLKVLGFSAVCYSRQGSPRPERNPVVLISVATSNNEEEQFLAEEDMNDEPVLESFMKYVRSVDPDVIVGYGTNGRVWSYLLERCRKLSLRLYVDRTKTEPHTSVYGHVSITGRVNVDLADYAEEFPEVKVKTLENLADYLGVMKLESRTLVEDVDIADHWDDHRKREILKRFSLDNTRCVMGVAAAVMDFAIQLSNLVGLPLDHVGTAAAGFRVEWFLIKRTHDLGELVPKRIEQPYRPYAGAIVLSPKPGLHENIMNLDFKSMYPSIMIAYNLSPDTYVPPSEPSPKGGVFQAPEVKHRFRKEPAGFYKEILSYLVRVRDEIRSNMKTHDSASAESRILDARQKAVKVITNATYGYAGWTGARWYSKPVAEAATAWGRYTIVEATKMAEKAGLKVVYGDTDSLFVTNDPRQTVKLAKDIEEKLGLEIKPDKVYVRIFFTEAKKRYAGLLPDGSVDIVGLEVMRGDWAAVARNVQEKVLEIILKEQSPRKASAFVQQFILDLRQKRVPYRDLVIWKTLTKPSEEYQVKASHVEAARMLQEKGWNLAVGDKIGYVVVVGTGRLYERVKPYMFATYDDVDVEYYVSKQVVPAAARVLESFGISEEQLLTPKTEEGETRKITDFFGT